jgi:hypothetical protein
MDLDASQHQNNQQYPLPGFNSTTQAHGAEGERQGREDAQRWACGQVRIRSGASAASLPALHQLSAAAIGSPMGSLAVQALGTSHSQHAALATMLLLGSAPPPGLSRQVEPSGGTSSEWSSLFTQRLLPSHLQGEFEEWSSQAWQWGETTHAIAYGTESVHAGKNQEEGHFDGLVWGQAARLGNLLQLHASQSETLRWEKSVRLARLGVPTAVACSC